LVREGIRERGRKKTMRHTILFLCPHNAAKSVMAAAYCQRLARQRGLDVQITSAGTEPDDTVSPSIVALLRAEGLDIAHHTPRQVTQEELGAAFRVISLGCDVRAFAPPGTLVEHWDDVPAPSQDPVRAWKIISAHVERLIEDLTWSARQPETPHLPA
jgi:arsenate reductase